MTLGEKITEARIQCGLTQEQLAEKMILQKSEIVKWESNAGLPDVDSLKVLAHLLNVNIDYLLDIGDEKQDTACLPQPSCDHIYAQEQLPQKTHSSDYVQGESTHGHICPPQNLPVLLPRQRVRPNGKRYFSARMVVYPIVFLVVHFLTQLLATVIAGISYLNSDSLFSLVDMTPDTTLNMIQEVVKAIGISALLYSSLLQITIYAIFLWYQKRKNQQYLLMRPTHVTTFPLGLATAFGCLGITTLLIQLFDMLAEKSLFWESMMVSYQQSTATLQGIDLLLTTLCVAILVPIAEELLFRGIITEEIRKVAPDWLAILISGVIFALVHGNLVQILYVLPFGFLLGASYIWSNSIWVPVLIHVVFNFFGSVFGTLIGENEIAQTVYTIFLIVMIPVGIYCAFIMYRMFRKNKKETAKKDGEKVTAQLQFR